MPVEILENLFFIERGYLNANHLAYRSESPILIDTAYIGDFHQTAAVLSGIGIDLARIGLIISTHCHCDHIGGNRILQEKSGCDIALHPLGRQYMDTRDNWSTWWRYYQQEAEFFHATRALGDGEHIAIGPHDFEVLHTPGHSADGIVLFNRQEKILLSSDALWGKDLPVMTLKVEGEDAVEKALKSLERLESLGPRKVFPGHGPPFTDTRQAISRSRQRLNRYLRHREQVGRDLLKKIIVYTLLMHGSAVEELFFPQLMGMQWFKETVETYFGGGYRATFDGIVDELLQKRALARRQDILYTTVKP